MTRAALVRHRLGLPPRTPWLLEALRLLAFIACGLLLGLAFLMAVDG